MAFAPSASWNSRSITHLANYPSPSLPMIFSDESEFIRPAPEQDLQWACRRLLSHQTSNSRGRISTLRLDASSIRLPPRHPEKWAAVPLGPSIPLKMFGLDYRFLSY